MWRRKMPYDIEYNDAAELIFDELQEFCKKFNIVLDEKGFVHGGMTPSHVLSLGYNLLAIAISVMAQGGSDK